MTERRALLFGCLFIFVFAAFMLMLSAKKSKSDDMWSGWYKAQKLNPEAKERIGVGWSSCCENSDVVKTKFMVVHSDADVEWWWWNKDRWDKVPGDIIHWNDPTPTGQPILFVYSGTPTCFYPGDSGG